MTERLPWLSIIGIGEDGLDGLSPAACRLLAQAELIVGGERHLGLIGPTAAERLVWPSPLTDALPAIVARRGRPVAVLASGDPFFYGVGATLMAVVSPADMLCLPAPSAFSLAAARLGWALQDAVCVSLHGRAFERIIPDLQPGARILALSWDGTTPARLAGLLAGLGMGLSRLTVFEAMGGPRENRRSVVARDFDLDAVDPLNTVAIEVVAGPDSRILPRAAGLADRLFEHDGQITKREVRALTLSALAPRRGELLWDVGAGSGSIGIEWMLADPANRAIAIEPRADRAARIARNAAALGVPGLAVVIGAAPSALEGLARPDAAFIGGGATAPGVFDAVWAGLKPGGRLVINAVTLETQAEIINRHKTMGGELVSAQFARAEPLGGFSGWRPAMPTVQWTLTKPFEPLPSEVKP